MKKFFCFILVFIFCFTVTNTALADYSLEAKLTKAGWAGKKSSITIIIDQPVPGTYYAIEKYPDSGVGHTFIRLEKVYKNKSYVTYFGFYPKARGSYQLPEILSSSSVKGKVYWLDDFFHEWNIARTFSITPEQADAVLKWAKSYNADYNGETNNCTTFAVNALKKAGLSSSKIGINKYTWTIPPKWRIVTAFKKWKGYSPGDAGEDIRGKSNTFTN